jgi:hypothetical protein
MHPFFTKQTSKSAKRCPSVSTFLVPLAETARQNGNEHEGGASPRMKVWDWVLDSWMLNYAALSLSFASLASTIFILGYYNGRPLSDWQHPLSFNTVLSLLATVVKGSTMLATATALSQSKWMWYHTSNRPLQDFGIFSDASRGPLGAAQLLVRLRMWHLASLGAVVTLLALFSDASVQASATFPLRMSDIGEAWIPISTNYTVDAIQPPVIATVDGVDPSLKSALYSGVLDAHARTTSSILTPECSSGDCSFPPYASLGICSECRNVTSRMRQEPELSDDLSFYDDSTFHLLTDAGTDLVLVQNNSQHNGTTQQVIGLINMTSIVGQPFRNLPITTSIKSNEVMGLSDTSIITTPGFDFSQVFRAFQCSLYLCMKVYDGNVTGGKLLETISTVVSTGWTSTYTEFDWVAASLNSTLRDGRQARVSVDASTLQSLTAYLGAGANGSPLLLLNNTGPLTGSGNDLPQQEWTNDIVQGIWANNAEDVTQTWENIADTMTANIRIQSGNKAVGTAHAPKPYIHVRWIFMLLPTAMVLLAILFIALTSWRSHVYEVPGWGSNALADVVYAGGVALEISATSEKEDTIERPETMLRASELERWAEGKAARLRFRVKGDQG